MAHGTFILANYQKLRTTDLKSSSNAAHSRTHIDLKKTTNTRILFTDLLSKAADLYYVRTISSTNMFVLLCTDIFPYWVPHVFFLKKGHFFQQKPS